MSMIPRWLTGFPKQLKTTDDFLERLEDLWTTRNFPTGLALSSDEKNIFVEAQVPGLMAKDIEVSIDEDHVLWIKGEKKEEEKDKKKQYYRRSQSSFSYCVPLWDEIDLSVEPQATCKEGIMKITFAKKKEKKGTGKKIQVT